MFAARSRLFIAALLALGVGCVAPDATYDPDDDAAGVTAGGKADGILDDAPSLTFGSDASGEVGGDRLELYRIALQRTDRIEVEMEVDSGDLNPHLTMYYGTSTYLSSESWERDGNVLRKVYLAQSSGTHLIAARAYRGEGQGDYTVRVRCVGGPCNGEVPPPDPDEVLSAAEVGECIEVARRCAFERLPRYEGRVGDARAAVLIDECLQEAAVADVACAGVADWVNPDEDNDAARYLLDAIREDLPFYADQSATCLGVLEGCISECHSASAWGYSGDNLQDTAEMMCWEGIWNGDCDSYARGHAACGGERLADSSADCTALCHSTTGAFIDDLDTACSSDSDCADYCDVDLGGAATDCGALGQDTAACYSSYLDSTEAYSCEGPLERRLSTFVDAVTCTFGGASVLPLDSTELSAHVTSSEPFTRSSYLDELEYQQIIVGFAHLGFVEAGAHEDEAFAAVDEGQIELRDVTFNDGEFEWLRAYAGDTEVGVVFRRGTTQIVGEVGDGDIQGCQ